LCKKGCEKTCAVREDGKVNYYLWPRPRKKGKPIFYVQFRNLDGSLSTAKSTGQTAESAAHTWVASYLSTGQVVSRENIRLCDYAQGFFDYSGQYIQRRLSRKGRRKLGQRHAENMASYMTNHVLPALGSEKLQTITSSRIETFQDNLLAKGLSASTTNHVISALGLVLKAAYSDALIRSVPSVDQVKDGAGAKRGILTKEEVVALFNHQWDNYRAMVVNLIAASSGMRLGEILALQWRRVDFTSGLITVCATIEKGFGLKPSTKTGRDRVAPVPSIVLSHLRAVRNESPWKDPEDFVFPSPHRKTPMYFDTPREALYRALETIGISEKERQRRGLFFHSWRHFFNSTLIHGKVPLAEIKRVTGHASDKMAEDTYFHLIDHTNIQKAQEELFNKGVNDNG